LDILTELTGVLDIEKEQDQNWSKFIGAAAKTVSFACMSQRIDLLTGVIVQGDRK
jgi:hypothetical protein